MIGSARILTAFAGAAWLSACAPLLPVFSDDVGCDDCDPGVAVEGSGGRLTKPTPEHPWIPLIDECMSAGAARADCIEALPPGVLAELEAWEKQNAAIRREQFQNRSRQHSIY